MEFAGSHILTVSQFERADVERLFAVADAMRPYAHRERRTRVLDGAILGSMFFEPSTRTRISFAAHLTCWAARCVKPRALSTRRSRRVNHFTTPLGY